MADSSAVPSPAPHKVPRTLPGSALLRGIRGDHVLLSAFVTVGVLIAYQLIVTLVQPPWIKPVTDWLRTALAWPQLFIVAWVAIRLARKRQPSAPAWACAALGMLSYAIARTTWTISNELLFTHGVPFPSLPDLFFILQYPCFIVAVLVIPTDRGWLPSLRTLVDGVLWMSAITALSWYFVLWPMSLQTGELGTAKYISIGYQIGDLVLLYVLVMALARIQRTGWNQLVIWLLAIAVASLFVADTWAAVLLLQPPHTYRTGSPPDLFWFIFYLLIPLAAVIRLRFPPEIVALHPRHSFGRVGWLDVLAGAQFVLPSLAVIGACVVIMMSATARAHRARDLMLPEQVTAVLLLLAALRPAVSYLDERQLRHARDEAEARERALRLANERMQTFVSVLGHELRTPLTSLVGNIQLMGRRINTMLRFDGNREDYVTATTLLQTLVERCDQSLARLVRLVADVLDEARIRQGTLELRLEPCDLSVVASEAVTIQMQLFPARDIRNVTVGQPVPVIADPSLIEQVVTNFVSNALKFSDEDQVVRVRVDVADGIASVSVHDDGVGIPLAEQPHIWDRFYRAEGANVQSGSYIGIGLGLYISKTIIEQHHGHVGVASAPGHGTTIWFTLPLAGNPPAEGVAPNTAYTPAASANECGRES